MKSRTVPVGRVTQWLSGGTPNRSVAEYWVGEIPWISASTLKVSEIHESDQHLTPEAVAVGSKMAPVGATLLLVRGSALHNEIRAGLVVAPVCFNQDIKALVPSPRIVPKFLTYSLLGRTQDLLKLVSTASNSAGVLDTKLVQSFEIYLPPNPEQRAIAEALSDVDGLLAALEVLIAKKRAVKQAAMQQLLTGKIRLPGFSGEWETKRLGEFASIRNYKVLPSNVPIGTPCVELDHIRQGDGRLLGCSTAQHSTSSKYCFFPSDVLFGRLRPYLRKFWLADRGGVCTTEIWPLMTNCQQADSGFLYAIVQSDQFIEAAGISYGTHMPRADWDVMRNVEFRLPQVQEQRAIAAIFSDMDAETATLEQRRDKTSGIKQGMRQRLLTGSVRLVKPE